MGDDLASYRRFTLFRHFFPSYFSPSSRTGAIFPLLLPPPPPPPSRRVLWVFPSEPVFVTGGRGLTAQFRHFDFNTDAGFFVVAIIATIVRTESSVAGDSLVVTGSAVVADIVIVTADVVLVTGTAVVADVVLATATAVVADVVLATTSVLFNATGVALISSSSVGIAILFFVTDVLVGGNVVVVLSIVGTDIAGFIVVIVAIIATAFVVVVVTVVLFVGIGAGRAADAGAAGTLF